MTHLFQFLLITFLLLLTLGGVLYLMGRELATTVRKLVNPDQDNRSR